jgi:glutamyl-tRNA synthetase
MRNYLVRLGWAHGDQEIFSTEEMIAAFDLPQIGRSPARFDFTKLESLNGHYMRQTADADLLAEMERVLPHIAGGPELAAKMTAELRAKLVAAMRGLKERAKTLIELVDGARFIIAARPLPIDDKAVALLTPDARTLLGELTEHLEPIEPWTAEATEQAIRAFAEGKGASSAASPSRCGRSPGASPRLRFRRVGGARKERKPRPVARSGSPPLAASRRNRIDGCCMREGASYHCALNLGPSCSAH